MLLFPRLAELIDWRKDHHPLEQELRKLAPEGEIGVRYVDALIRVRLLSGDERILHAEVQTQKLEEFSRRSYIYDYRSYDHFDEAPETLVILGDDDPSWRPNRYVIEREYSKRTFEFQPVKLLDWANRKDELCDHENPMGLFVLSHLEAQRTHGNDEERARVKLDLLVRLAARNMDAEEKRQWHRYLDWFLDLPPDVNRQVYAKAQSLTGEQTMPFITFPEREGRRQGEIKGLQAGIEALLRARFGEQGKALIPQVRQIEDPVRLGNLLQTVETAVTLDEIRPFLPPADAPPAS